MLYCAARFGLEFLRGDYAEKVLGFMTSGQTTSAIGFVIALICFIAAPKFTSPSAVQEPDGR